MGEARGQAISKTWPEGVEIVFYESEPLH